MTDVFDDLARAFKAGHDAGRSEAADEIERLRSGRNACEEQFQDKVNQIIGMMDEIERLRDALREIMLLSDKRSPHPMSSEADYFRIARAALGEKE